MAVRAASWGVVFVAVLMLSTACMSLTDHVPTSALKGQPEGQRLRDARDCGGAGTDQTVEAIRAFSSCMIARGYRDYVLVSMTDCEIHEPYHSLAFLVQADRAQSRSEVQADLGACQSAVDAVVAAPSTVTKYIRAVVAHFTLGFNIHALRASREYELCLLDKGYTVAVWRAEQ